MTVFYAVLGFVVLERGAELILAHRNTARLLRQGAREIDRAGYQWFVVLHAGWLAALAATVPAATAPDWPLLALLFLLQAGRGWTTRLIVLPAAPPVVRGPYRWLSHPNYLIVFGEVAILPLAFDAIALAIAFSLCNGALLLRRIRLEQAALGISSHHIRETLPHRN
jgi:methyltransferase